MNIKQYYKRTSQWTELKVRNNSPGRFWNETADSTLASLGTFAHLNRAPNSSPGSATDCMPLAKMLPNQDRTFRRWGRNDSNNLCGLQSFKFYGFYEWLCNKQGRFIELSLTWTGFCRQLWELKDEGGSTRKFSNRGNSKSKTTEEGKSGIYSGHKKKFSEAIQGGEVPRSEKWNSPWATPLPKAYHLPRQGFYIMLF